MSRVEGVGGEPSAEASRLARSVDATLHLIAVARDEREAQPVQAARRNLAAVYGLTRLRRRQERLRRGPVSA